MSESSEIDNALVAKLGGDATLLSYAPNGVYWEGEVPPGATRFVEVSLVEAPDEQMFGGRAFESPLYLVKVVERGMAGDPKTSKQAAARIDQLLDPQPPDPPATLTVPGYGVMLIQRELRIRIIEVDDENTDIRWRHRGGHYRVMVAAPKTDESSWIQPGWVQG